MNYSMLKQATDVETFVTFLHSVPKDVQQQIGAVNVTLERILIAEHNEYYNQKKTRKPTQEFLNKQIEELVRNEHSPKNTILYVQLLKKIFVQN